MKAQYRSSECDFCRYIKEDHPDSWWETEGLVEGRIYTIITMVEFSDHRVKGYGVRVAEYILPPGNYHCSCSFREIDGDKDAWKELYNKHKPKVKPKELEPA